MEHGKIGPGVCDIHRPSYMVVVIVVVVVLTLTHGYNAVRGHRTGSNNSGAEIISGGKQLTTEGNTHNNQNKSCTSDKKKNKR